jgi:hypothetical protein
LGLGVASAGATPRHLVRGRVRWVRVRVSVSWRDAQAPATEAAALCKRKLRQLQA